MRADSREILRADVFLWRTPFEAARMISGCASRRASDARALSPDVIASSTRRMNVLIRDRRAVFTAVRLAILRTIFLADFVFAIDNSRRGTVLDCASYINRLAASTDTTGIRVIKPKNY